jgi:hypothetical protein
MPYNTLPRLCFTTKPHQHDVKFDCFCWKSFCLVLPYQDNKAIPKGKNPLAKCPIFTSILQHKNSIASQTNIKSTGFYWHWIY